MTAVVNKRSEIELNNISVWLVRDYRCSTVRLSINVAKSN